MINEINHWVLNKMGIEHDAEELSILSLLAKVTGKTNEVVKKLNSQSHDIENIYNANKEKMEYGNVRRFGAKGDGVTDDTKAFNDCITACNNGQTMYIPNGNYIINDKITVTHENFVLKGEGVNARLNTSNNTPVILDLSSVINLTVEDITCDNSKINIYPNDYINNMEDRNFNIKNLFNNNETVATTNWGLFISTPKPTSYDRTFTDSKYARYPIEISNHGGYNAININNVAQDEEGNAVWVGDNSAIGITDKVNNGNGTILIDMYGKRRFLNFVRKGAPYVSGKGSEVVFNVSPDGEIGVGCSYEYDDPIMTGGAILKGRGLHPLIRLQHGDNSVEQMYIGMVNDETLRISYRGEKSIVVDKNQRTTFFNGIIVPSSVASGIRMTRGTNTKKIYLDSNGEMKYSIADSTNDGEGYFVQTSRNGTTTQRPTGLLNTSNFIGYQYFDTTLGKPIWWNGTKWIDATGVTV